MSDHGSWASHSHISLNDIFGITSIDTQHSSGPLLEEATGGNDWCKFLNYTGNGEMEAGIAYQPEPLVRTGSVRNLSPRMDSF